MPLIRPETWEIAFHKFLVDNANLSFEWGTQDCCMFPADAILSFTGVDIADDFRGKYATQQEAFDLIHAVTGGSTVADAAVYCATQHGLPKYEHPLMAKRGDLVVISNGGTLIAGIVHLNGRHAVTMSEKGVVRLPITNVIRSWQV